MNKIKLNKKIVDQLKSKNIINNSSSIQIKNLNHIYNDTGNFFANNTGNLILELNNEKAWYWNKDIELIMTIKNINNIERKIKISNKEMEIKNLKNRYIISTNEQYPIVKQENKFVVKNIKNKIELKITLLKGDTINWELNVLNKNSLDLNIYFNNNLLKIIESTLIDNFENKMNNIIYKKLMQYQYNKIFNPTNVMGYNCLSKEIKDLIDIDSYKNLSENLISKKIKNNSNDGLKIKILDKIIKSSLENKKRIKKISSNYENILEKNTKYFYDLNKKSEIIENMEFKNNNLKLKNNSLSIANKKQKEKINKLNGNINKLYSKISILNKEKNKLNDFENKFNTIVLKNYIRRITFMNTKIIKKNIFFKKKNKSLEEINCTLKNINSSYKQKESKFIKNLNSIKVKLNKESLKKRKLNDQIYIMKNNYEYELKKKLKKEREKINFNAAKEISNIYKNKKYV